MNPVAFAKLNTVVPAVVCANTILLVPKAIDRAVVVVELNIPGVKSPVPKVNIPPFSV